MRPMVFRKSIRISRCSRISMAGLVSVSLFTGCATTQNSPSNAPPVRSDLRSQSVEVLRAGLKYEANPIVRVQSVEAIGSTESSDLLPWLRTALLDDQPAVRFAACVTLGTMRDKVSESKIRDLLRGNDVNVKLAALYAIHRLGDSRRTGELSSYLLQDKDVIARRHAAMLIGLIGDPSAIKLLAKAMRDSDAGVRINVLASMARLGSKEAKQELVFMTTSGVGADETLAIQSLAESRDQTYLETYRYKLANAMHTETKLAAARALGMLGNDEGFEEAIKIIRTPPAPRPDPKDPPADQALRVKQLAAGALGEIGKSDALPVLSAVLQQDKDPRVQVSAAQAVLKILKRQRSNATSEVLASPATKRK